MNIRQYAWTQELAHWHEPRHFGTPVHQWSYDYNTKDWVMEQNKECSSQQNAYSKTYSYVCTMQFKTANRVVTKGE